jgi:eukaryotic-like serine/threonine-protein kinase
VIDEIVNNYRVTALLGEGGMGSVYLAEHPFMGRKAAIKVLRREYAEDVGLVERFMNEARAANAIRHPNIIDIIDVGRMPSGIPYLMMEFLEGESLARRVDRGTLAVPEAVDIMLQTTAALAAAHGKGIVHRDLKPDNLYLVPDESAPGGVRVKVLDFGIAKLRGELTGGSVKTQAGSVMGTPPYMSPEQCRGITDEVDHRTDIYATGIILYEMLCGAPPFVSAGWGEIVLAHMTKPPEPPRALNPSVPEWIEAVILKALAKAPSDRFQSALEMRASLRSMSPVATFPPRVATGPAVAAQPTRPLEKPPTTFRVATGQLAFVKPTLAESPNAKRGARRSSIVVGAGAAIVAVVAVAALVAAGKKQGTASVVAAPPAAAATPPTIASPPTMAPPAPAPPRPPALPAAPQPETPPAQRVMDSRRMRPERQKTRTSAKKSIGSPAVLPAAASAPPPLAPPPAASPVPPIKPKAAEKW